MLHCYRTMFFHAGYAYIHIIKWMFLYNIYTVFSVFVRFGPLEYSTKHFGTRPKKIAGPWAEGLLRKPVRICKDLFRRKASNALGTLLQSNVDVHVKVPQHAKCMTDVGHLLHVVHRSYLQVDTLTLHDTTSKACGTKYMNIVKT